MGLLASLAPDLIGAGASLIGNIFGASSQSSANATNLKIAQMNNEFNERMLDKQLAYNADQWQKQVDYNNEMWNKTNEWNSASAQFRRYKEAGLNPYLMMGQGSAGTAQSQSAPSSMGINTPTATPVSVQPFRPDASSIAQSFSRIGEKLFLGRKQEADAAKSEQEAESLRIDNQTRKFENNLRIFQMMNAIKESKGRIDWQKIQNDLALQSFSSDLRERQLRPSLTEASIQLQQAQRVAVLASEELTRKQIKWFDADMISQLSVRASQINLNSASARAQLAQEAKSIAETKGIKISNYIAEKTADVVIDTTKYNSDTSYWNSVGARNNSGPRDAWQRVNSELLNGNESYRFGKHFQNVLGIIGSFLPKF